MSFTVSYDLPGYPRQHELSFARVEDAEARSNALAEQGIAESISVSEGEEVAAEAPTAGATTINVEVTVELPATPDEAAD